MIFDSSIVIELAEESTCAVKKLTFNSFDNRDEVLECITSIWQAQSAHAQNTTNMSSEDGEKEQEEEVKENEDADIPDATAIITE